jgi:hypothetical protein
MSYARLFCWVVCKEPACKAFCKGFGGWEVRSGSTNPDFQPPRLVEPWKHGGPARKRHGGLRSLATLIDSPHPDLIRSQRHTPPTNQCRSSSLPPFCVRGLDSTSARSLVWSAQAETPGQIAECAHRYDHGRRIRDRGTAAAASLQAVRSRSGKALQDPVPEVLHRGQAATGETGSASVAVKLEGPSRAMNGDLRRRSFKLRSNRGA